MRRMLTLIGLALLACLMISPGAQASTTFNGTIYDGDWGSNDYGVHSHSAHVWWVSSSHDPDQSDPRDHFGGSVVTNDIDLTEADNNNHCIQIAFDWTGSETAHYDSRIIRNCDSNSTKTVQYIEPNKCCSGGPRNMQADNLQIATFNGGEQTDFPVCWNPPPNETCDSWNPWGRLYSSHLFLREADGTNGGHSGGDPTLHDG